MQKNKKRIFTAVITALFVLSVSYFALLSPTTAWFYQDYSTTKNFSFKKFDETYDSTISNVSIPLRAATRFADSGEWLFDEVAHIVKIPTTCESTSELSGIVHVDVTGLTNTTTGANNTGIYWCAFALDGTESDATDPIVITSPSNGQKGTYKTKIESILADYGVTAAAYTDKTTYEAFNEDAIDALEAYNKTGFVLTPGTTKTVYIVFWGEYGKFTSGSSNLIESTTTGGKGANWSTGPFTANIKVEARPYLGAYSTDMKTLTFSGNYSGVTIYYADGTTETPSTSTVSVPANTQMRIKTTSGSFTPSDASIGAISGTGSNVCTVANMSGNLTLTIS